MSKQLANSDQRSALHKAHLIDGSGANDYYRAEEVDALIVALEAERDEAVENANNYRQRVFDFLDGMTAESEGTQALEEGRGLEPLDREQYRRAIAYIRQAFENHNYLTEAQLAGSVASTREAV